MTDRPVRLYHLDKSAMAEHSINLGQHIQFKDTSILTMTSRHIKHIFREAIGNELHSSNMNKEIGFFLSKSKKFLLQTQQE
jgi:hypothetical protein